LKQNAEEDSWVHENLSCKWVEDCTYLGAQGIIFCIQNL